jgi:meso-butanediol dehydrogenase/(S,S)-butanediol dehydrogenase/diacetyl reductase
LRFPGKAVFLTGAGGGIGSQVANSFAFEGASVFLTDARADLARKAAAEINAKGGKAFSEKLDVTSISEIYGNVETAIQKLGRIDILVNCAGIVDVHSFDEITEKDWDNMIAVNAKGVFFSCQAVAKKMIEGGVKGKIVNISSSAGKIGIPLYLHYCASKFAVLGITKTLAIELAKHHINVNAVCPADVDTDMLASEFKIHAARRQISEEMVKQELIAQYPLGRLGTPIDIANAILFLASDEANHITGQEISINGGMRY